MKLRSNANGIVLVALFAGLCASTGCELRCGAKTLNRDEAEMFLAKKFAEQKAVVKEVRCPDTMKVEKGAAHLCHITAEGGDLLEVELTQVNDNGGMIVTKSDTMIAMANLRPQLEKLFADNSTTAGIDIVDVSCPPDHKARTGRTFECQVTGKEPPAYVVSISETDDEGAVQMTPIGISIPPEELVKTLTESLASQQITATVSCGEAPVRLLRGSTAQCQATDSHGKSATIEMTPTNASGLFDWRIVDQ